MGRDVVHVAVWSVIVARDALPLIESAENGINLDIGIACVDQVPSDVLTRTHENVDERNGYYDDYFRG